MGRRQKLEELKKAQKRSKNDSFRTKRHEVEIDAIPTPLRPGIGNNHIQPEPVLQHVVPTAHSDNSTRRRSRTMSFLGTLAKPSRDKTSKKDKASRFLDVAAAAEVPPAETTPVQQQTVLSPASSRHPADFSPASVKGDGADNDRFASVARMQQDLDVADVVGRYSDLDAAIVRVPLPPRFKRPRRSTVDRLKRVFGQD